MESITLQVGNTIISSGNKVGQMQFAASAESDGGASRYIIGQIYAQAEGAFNASSNPASIVISTSAADSLPASGKLKITHEGHVLPMKDNAYDLGSPDFRFRDLYVTSEVTSPSGNFDYIFFDTTIGDEDLVQGQMNWNSEAGTVELGLTNDVKIQIGQTVLFRVKNSTGSTLSKGQAVYASGVLGGGQIIQAAKFAADESVDEVRFIGLMTDDLANGEDGYVNHFGHIKNADLRTSNTVLNPNGETWAVGDILYVDDGTAGGLTKNPPQNDIYVALVLADGQNGELFVRITDPGHITDLHDVNLSGLVDNNLMVWNSGANYWEPSSGLYYVDGNLGVGTSSPNATLHVYSPTPSGTIFNAEGTNGSLFSVVDNLSGVLMSVNTIAGLPVLEVNSDYSVTAGRFNQNDFVITSSGNVGMGIAAPSGKLHVVGEIYVDNLKLDGNTLSTTNTNGNLILTPNGTGGIQSNPNGFAIGSRAIDLQTSRNLSAEVASGGTSTISGGASNKATGTGSTVGGGVCNYSTNNYSSIGAGYCNCVQGAYGTIAGGYINCANGDFSIVGGGRQNTASGACSTVAGGKLNTSSAQYGFIGGGDNNQVYGADSLVVGGSANVACNTFTAIVGGANNLACYGSFIGGGYGNTSSSWYATIGGGCSNTASASYSIVAGGCQNIASGAYSFIGGGSCNIAASPKSVAVGGFCSRACGSYSFVGGGYYVFNYGDVASAVGGQFNTICSTASFGFIGAGQCNKVCACAGVVTGGEYNCAVCHHSSVTGGAYNFASGDYSAVVAGSGNIASGACSFVAGGVNNTSSGQYSFVGNGSTNFAQGTQSAVINGWSNYANGVYSFIGNGFSNVASNTYSFIGGGGQNAAFAEESTVGAGRCNCACGYRSSVLGGLRNKAIGDYSAVVGGSTNYAGSSAVVGGGQSNCASGSCSFVGGGCVNCSIGAFGVVGGGVSNKSCGACSTVSGGYVNIATGSQATIGGGFSNRAFCLRSTVSGGYKNEAIGSYSTIGGGNCNYAQNTATASFIGGGEKNYTTCVYSAVVGGLLNVASGDYSAVVAGSGNLASGTCSFVGGGNNNTSSSCYSSVLGGKNNTVSNSYGGAILGGASNSVGGWGYSAILAGYGNYTLSNSYNSVIAGGYNNCADENYGFIANGRHHKIESREGFIGGGLQNYVQPSGSRASNYGTIVNGESNRICGGPGGFIGNGGQHFIGGCGSDSAAIVGGWGNCSIGSRGGFIGGGWFNTLSSCYSVLGGGKCNVINAGSHCAVIAGGISNVICANSILSTIGGGNGNYIYSSRGTIAGGCNNKIYTSSTAGTVSGGYCNQVLANLGFIGGGQYNITNGCAATVAGGECNCVTGNRASILGGNNNTASGVYSAILGGQSNNDGGNAAVFILGTGITATSANTTYTQKLNVSHTTEPSGTLFNVEGSNGSLFSVVDNLSGVLMSVNNNAGLPVFEVYDDDSIIAGRFAQNDFVISSSGNVGIGTAAPSEKLHLSGEALFSATGGRTSKTVGTDSSLEVENGLSIFRSTGVYGWLLTSNASNHFGIYNWNRNGYVFTVEDNSPVNSFYLKNNGYLGIGTTFPSYKLHVAGDISANANNVYAGGFSIYGDTNNKLTKSGNDFTLSAGQTTTDIHLGYYNGGTLNKVVTVDSSEDRVGILNTAPAYTLDVTGSGRFTSNMNVEGDIYASGNVGIGTNAPSSELHVKSGGGPNVLTLENETYGQENRIDFITPKADTTLNTSSIGSSWAGHGMYFKAPRDLNSRTQGGFVWYGADGNEKMVLRTYYPALGIGTNNPQYTLDVNGDSNLGGNVIVGGNLTVNGTTISTNVDTIEIQDPIITLGLTSGNIVTNDSYDRGVAMVTNNGTAFMGWDNSADKFVMLASGVATNGSGNYDAGVYGDLHVGSLALDGDLTFDDITYRISWDNGTEYIGRYADGIIIGAQGTAGLYLNSLRNLGVGTTSPAAKLHVEGDIIADYLRADTYNLGPGGAIKLSGSNTSTSQYLAFGKNAGGSAQSFTEHARFTTDGNFGIGTTTPSYKLDVAGTTAITPTAATETLILGRSTGYASVTSTTSNELILDSDGAYTSLNHYSSDDVILGYGGGNVGIGTASPLYPLHVSKDGGASTVTLLRFANANATYSQSIDLKMDTSKNITWDAGSSNGGIFSDAGINGFGWLINGSGIVDFKGDGKVGIGTTSPQVKLHIAENNGTDEFLRFSDTSAANVASVRAYQQYYFGENTTRLGYLGITTNQTFDIATTTSGGNIRMFTGSNQQRMQITSAGDVGIGTTTPTTLLDVSGVITANGGNSNEWNEAYDWIQNSGLDGTGSASGVAFWTDSNTLSNDSALIWDSTNNRLGLGITSPAALLHVNGSAIVHTRGTTPDIGLRLDQTYSTHGSLWIDTANGTMFTYTGFYGHKWATSTGEAVRITQNRDVGIGVTSPSWKLQVQSTSDNIASFTNGGYYGLDVTRNNTSYGAINVKDAGGRSIKVGTHPGAFSDSDAYLSDIANGLGAGVTLSTRTNADNNHMSLRARGDVAFYTNTGTSSLSERMRIAAGGNVGIGTTTPSGNLNIHTINNNDYGQVSLSLAGITSKVHLFVGNSDTRPFLASTHGGTNGQLSTSVYGWGFFDRGTDGDFQIKRKNSSTSWTDVLHIKRTDGNVGIGTASPSSKLHVSGGILIVNNGVGNGYYEGHRCIFEGTSTHAAVGSSAYQITNITSEGLTIGRGVNKLVTVDTSGNVGIGTATPSQKLDVVGSGNFSGDVTITGHLSAATKSFYIDHPTKEGKLQYGSLESPYHGIRLTGRGKIEGGKCVVELPDYINALVRDDENVNIQLTNYRHGKVLYVDDIDISNNCFTVKCDSWFGGGKEFFWSFTAVRKDVQELKVEC